MSKIKRLNVGIDVASKKHDLAIMMNGKWVQTEFENSDEGHKKIVRYLCKHGKESYVCIEATGIYHLDLGLALHNAKNIHVMIVNPKASKNFASAIMQRGKTDRADARMLAEFTRRMDFVEWQPPRQAVWELRDISRRSNVLAQMRASEMNRFHAARNDTIENDIEVNVRHLDRRMKRLEEKAVDIINGDDELLTTFTLLTTIKGVAERSAIRIMGEIMMLPKDMTARQWVAHAGLDPRSFESGSSVKKAPRISKVGNIHLRNALYMPALTASRHDENVKAFREVLKERGKTAMQGVVAVMRKLLHTIHGMLKNKTAYRSEFFYQPEQKKA